MSGLSNVGESLVLTTLMTSRYISLHNSDPGNAGDFEVTGDPYARQGGTWAISGNNPSVLSNSVVIQFDTATEDWGNIAYFGVWTAGTGGEFLGGWPMTISKSVAAGDTARWDVGKLRIATDDLL